MATLNARQLKVVHMHSSIFDTDGPSTASLYSSSRQQEIFAQLKGSLGNGPKPPPPDISLPKAGDIKATLMAGHQGAILPSSGAQRQPSPQNSPLRERTSSTVLVHHGEAKPVVKAAGQDVSAIPKEFWSTGVKLNWHDTRNEQCRDRRHGQSRQTMDAKELKRQELSSEVLGKDRMTEPSTTCPKQDLLADTANLLNCDSVVHRHSQPSEESPSPKAHRIRTQANLASSQSNPMPRSQVLRKVETPTASFQSKVEREQRVKDCNYSDLFGFQPLPRSANGPPGGRKEMTDAGNTSFLDARTEIAVRNKDRWRHPEEVPAAARKEAESTSHLFELKRADHPENLPVEKQVFHEERTRWCSRQAFDTTCEVARRARHKDQAAKDFADPENKSHLTRKQEDLSSSQVRLRIGGTPGPAAVASPLHRLAEPLGPHPPAPVADREQLLRSAKATKQASLQSSIFS